MKVLSKMLFPNPWITLLAFSVSGYLMLKKRIFILFIVPIIVWVIFFFTIYFAAWHEGIIYSWWAICVMKSLDIVVTWKEWKKKVTLVLLLLIFAFQFKWSWTAWFNDIKGPYCGAEALAAEIKRNHWDKKRIYGYGELSSTLNFYFSENIFKNSWKPENRFYSWNQEEDLVFPADGIIRGNPDFIIAHQFDSKMPPKVFLQYRCIGRFVGHMYWKDKIGDGSFDLYRKE